jgi:hypothetical protein
MKTKTPTPSAHYREPSEKDIRTAAIGGGVVAYPKKYRSNVNNQCHD